MLQALLLAAVLATPQPMLFHPQDYQDYVVHWHPANAPLCKAFTSLAMWEQTLHPAAVMGTHRPFAPPAAFWHTHALLFVARSIYAGPVENVLNVRSVARTRDRIVLDYTFAPNPHASSTMDWWIAAAVAKPLPALIVFRENGRAVCTH